MGRIYGIDGLRAIAILCVLAQHQFLSYFAYLFGPIPSSLGGIGVSIFFVISGFLITGILLREKDSQIPTHYVFTKFYARRVLRIFPIYYIVIATGVLLHWDWFYNIYPWHLLFATNIYIFYVDHWIGYAGQFWSLAIEEQFYLIWPAVIMITPSRRLLEVIVVTIFFGFLWGPLLRSYGASDLQVYVAPFAHFDELGLGAFVAYMNLYKKETLRAAMPGTAILTVLALVAIVLYVGVNYWSYNSLSDYLHLRVFAVFAALAIATCVYAGPESKFVHVLEFWPLRELGRISYGVYLIHNLMPLAFAGTRFDLQGKHTLLGFVVLVGATLALSTLSWRLIEKPILDLKPGVDRFLKWLVIGPTSPEAGNT